MMTSKNKIVVSIVALATLLISWQSLEIKAKRKIKLICTYKISYRPDSTSKNISTETMQLLISDTLSEFASLNKLKLDSIIDVEDVDGGGVDMSRVGQALAAPKSKFGYRIYKAYTPATCWVYDDIFDKHYKYMENAFPCKWVINQTRSKIAGYACQEATTVFAGRRYKAWFTREIPVTDGPYKFSGLPGLIVKISDVRNEYDFELVSVVRPTKVYYIDFPHRKTIAASKTDYIKGLKAANSDAINRLAQSGITFDNPEQVQRQYQQRLKRNNNAIELGQ